MNRFNKYLKAILAMAMVALHFVVPASTIAFATDTGVSAANDTTLQPAHTGYVPELLFAGDMLPYIEETEIFLPIMGMGGNAPAPGSGIVQLVLEPVLNRSGWVNWICVNPEAGSACSNNPGDSISVANARAAAFNAGTIYHRIFSNATTLTDYVGVNGRYGRDALFLGTSANGQRYRVLIAGRIGYVNRIDNLAPRDITVSAVRYDETNSRLTTFPVRANAQFVPFNNYPNNSANGGVGSISHYVNRGGHLYRYLTNNVSSSHIAARFLTGPAPSWMPQNVRLYSFDGVFFYANPRNIRTDGVGALNASYPFFNYFQYLSFRSHSTVTAAQLDSFLVSPNINSFGNRWHTLTTTTSIMRNQGQAFVDAQNRYGINALLVYAKAMHESAGGTSIIARTNNNLFGLGAFDGDPAGGAHRFATPAASVESLANIWLSRGYLWHTDWRNAGPHAGHKGSGMNVFYATDPYWGQKIAGWAFRIDSNRPAAERDLNREQIAIRQNTSSVPVQNAAGGTLYNANRANYRFFPFLVTGTGTNNRLQVTTDTAIENGVVNRNALFNRATAIGYIPNTNVWMAGAAAPATPPEITLPNDNNNNSNNSNNNNNNNNNNQPSQNIPNLPTGIAQPTRRVVPTTTTVSGLNAGGTVYVRNSPDNGNTRGTFNANGTTITVLGTAQGATHTWLLIRFNATSLTRTATTDYGWLRADFASVNLTTLTDYTPSDNNGNGSGNGAGNGNGGGSTNRGWIQTESQWFFYNVTGQRETGWVRSGSRWYFLNPAVGQPEHNTNVPVGAMLDGWITEGNQRYFLNPLPGQAGHRSGLAHGAMHTGWSLINNQWYFFNPGAGRAGRTSSVPLGAMRDGWVGIGSQWFFLNPRSGQAGHAAALPHGVMRDGWVQVNSNWFFLNPTTGQPGHTNALAHGVMRTGTIQVSGRTYNLDSQGRLR